MLLGSTAAHAAGNAATGKRLYDERCLGCHGDAKTAPVTGPSLVGIIGRKAGTGGTGVHSRTMTESGVTWNEANLRAFLAAPMKAMPGTTMPTGVPNAAQIDDIIAYLRTLH